MFLILYKNRNVSVALEIVCKTSLPKTYGCGHDFGVDFNTLNK